MSIKSGTVIAMNYRIERPLSESGGMSTVFLAGKVNDPKLRLAMKFSRTEAYSPTHEDKLLERESLLLRRWDWRHPGIVRLYPIEREGQNPEYLLKAIELPDHPYFIAMEYLRGDSLAKNLSKTRNFPLEWKLELFYQILQAVSFLHQKGYGHRDIKPDNIMFREPIAEHEIPQPVLIDFALACNDDVVSDVVEKSYTLEYASPERVMRSTGMGSELGVFAKESDIWSLGVILYELLTGEHLFKGGEQSVRTTLIEGTFRSKVQDLSAAKPYLTAFVRGMLQENATKRPTVKEVIYALEEMFPPPRVKVF